MKQHSVKEWQIFSLTQLRGSLRASGRLYYSFLDEAALSAGLYRLPAGGKDEQQPHRIDEIYYVLEGKAKLDAGEKTFDAVPGNILFVKAEVEHRFKAIEEDFLTLVVFSKGTPHPDDDEAAAFSWKEERRRLATTPFFDQHTLRMEVFSDPEITTGKSEFSRIYQILQGAGMLQVGAHRTEVTPGALLYLEAGEEAVFTAEQGAFAGVVYGLKVE